MKIAFEDLSTSEPYLPFSDSVLPAILALKKTHESIAVSRAHLALQAPVLTEARKQLDTSRAALADQKALSTALAERVATLRADADGEMEQDPDELAQRRVDDLAERKKRYDHERHRLLKLLRDFVDGRLAPLLAAEQLGGPVVGDAMEVEGENLAAGFNAQGRPKKAKGSTADEDRRQRRLDEIWGAVRDDREGASGGRGGGKEKEWDEVAAAGKEMKELVMLLLNQLIKAKGDKAASYIEVTRESAAARFLVRSKVAQLHPRDATRLRLVDFGHEIDD